MTLNLEGKKILVVGLGVQGGGVGLVKFLLQKGAKVRITDLRTKEQLKASLDELNGEELQLTLGEHKIEDFLNVDIIFKGPSVPWDLPELKKAQEKGIPVEMEVSFFAEHCKGKIIGITGTRGKSTVTTLLSEILGKLYKHGQVHVGGNLPNQSTVSLLDKVSENNIVILELSSWALSGFHRKKLSPHIAVFTNFYPDHLNYYKTEEEYFYDKKAIYLYQTDKDLLFANKTLEDKIKLDNPKSRVSYFSKDDYSGELQLKGDHNRENAAAALQVAKSLGFNEDEAREIIKNFSGLSYRQERVGEKDGVVFINDTTSTTPIATEKALDSFKDKPIVLILGGNTKNLPTDSLLANLNKAKQIVLLKGSFTDEIKSKLNTQQIIGEFDNLKQAIEKGFDKAKELGDSYLLFSPGATSFAMFKNEFDRGDQFNRIVKSL